MPRSRSSPTSSLRRTSPCPRASPRPRPCRRARRCPRRPRRRSSATASRTNSGSVASLVPSTMRSTPASASRCIVSSVRMPPPISSRAPVSRAMRSTTSMLPGTPSRAPSRSTTWIHSAPCSAKLARLGDRVLVVDGHAVVVALGEAHGAPAEDVDCGKDDHARAPSAMRPKFASSCSPIVEDFSGWNCTAKTLSRLHGRGEPHAVLGRADDRRSSSRGTSR